MAIHTMSPENSQVYHIVYILKLIIHYLISIIRFIKETVSKSLFIIFISEFFHTWIQMIFVIDKQKQNSGIMECFI